MLFSITAPNEGYTGWANIGPVAVQFTNGLATYEGESLPEGVKAYLEANGYTVEEKEGFIGVCPVPEPTPDPEPEEPEGK